MANSQARKIMECCEKIAGHTCSNENSDCARYRQELHSILTSVASFQSQDVSAKLPLEKLVFECYNELVAKVNAKGVCAECDTISRCFICWLINLISIRTSSGVDSLVQQADIVLKSVKLCLHNTKDEMLLRRFEELLRFYHGSLRNKYSIGLLAAYRLKISLCLSLLNARLGRVKDAETFLVEAETQGNSSTDSEDIVGAFCSIVHALHDRNPPALDDAIHFAEKCRGFMEKRRVFSADKKIQILRFLAVVSAKKGDFAKALDYISFAQAVEKRFLLLVTRLRILVLSNAAGQTDFSELTSAMQDIISCPDFTITSGVNMAKRLYADNYAVVAEHFLTLMWQSLDKALEINAEIFPLFCFRLRLCLQKGDISKTQEMFMWFTKAPHLLSEMPLKIGMTICSMLNWHAVTFVKTRQFEPALACFEMCDNFLRTVLPKISEPDENKLIDNRLANSVPSVSQIKRSLALCQFLVGSPQCEQTLRDAESLEDSPWIDFLWYYMAVRSADDSAALKYLQKVFFSHHDDVADLLRLSSDVALAENKPQIAVTALDCLVTNYFEKSDSPSSDCEAANDRLLSAIKTLLSLAIKSSTKEEDVHCRSYKQLCSESQAFAGYLAKAHLVLTRMVQSTDERNPCLIEDVKWFSENSWHISNKTNGLLTKKIEQAADQMETEEGDYETLVSLRLASFELYRHSADIVGLLCSATKSDPGKILHKYCLCLSLCLASGIHYLHLLNDFSKSRKEIASSLLLSLKECYKVIDTIACNLSCGGMPMHHTLPIFGFEILLNLEEFDEAGFVIQKFADENNVSNENKSSFKASVDAFMNYCAVFEKFAKVAEEYAVRCGGQGMVNCYASFELCLESLSFALASYRSAEAIANGDFDFGERVKALAIRIRSTFQFCRRYASDKFFTKNSSLFVLMQQLSTSARNFWKNTPPSEAEWIMASCWNSSLQCRTQNLKGDAKAWCNVAVSLAESRDDTKMLPLLREKMNNMKKWDCLESDDSENCCI